MSRSRRPVASDRAGFDDVLSRVEIAKEALVAAVPSPRGIARRSLAEAVADFEEGLRAASSAMASWSPGEAEEPRRSCRRALDESLARVERLRLSAPPLDYEGLVAALGDLIEPLDAFEDADRLLDR